MNKSVEKTLLKGTILLALFSILLEISLNTLLDYGIFVGLWYAMLTSYIAIKQTYKYEIGEDSILTSSFFGLRSLRYTEINLVFVRSGFLQKKFGLSTVFIISTRYNVLIRDVSTGESIKKQVTEKMDSAKIKEITPSEQ